MPVRRRLPRKDKKCRRDDGIFTIPAYETICYTYEIEALKAVKMKNPCYLITAYFTCRLLFLETGLFNYTTRHTRATAAKWGRVIGVVIATGVDHEGVTAHVV